MSRDYCESQSCAEVQSLSQNKAGGATPPHIYAQSGEAPHFSYEDFNFRKALCLTDPRRKKNDESSEFGLGTTSKEPQTWQSEDRNAGSVSQGLPGESSASVIGGVASCDKQREALIKWHYYNHRKRDLPNIQELMQPGDQDHGDEQWGVLREVRSSYVPHWSLKQMSLKKAHHAAAIHKTAENAAAPDMQSTSHSHFQDPRTVASRVESASSASGSSHIHNSHMHLSCAKRRHDVCLENRETDYRSCHPPAASHPAHFFVGPEPQHMACHLYPEGPSITARHVPEHFVDNVKFEVDHVHPFDRTGGCRGSSQSTTRGPSPSKIASCSVWDGTREIPVRDLIYKANPRLVESADARAAGPTSARYANRTSPRRARSGECSPSSSLRSLRSPDIPSQSPVSFDYRVHAGKPPPASTRRPEDGHIYTSHTQMEHDKRSHQAAAYRPIEMNSWEHIEAGSLRGERASPSSARAMQRSKSFDSRQKVSPVASENKNIRQSPRLRASSSERNSLRRVGSERNSLRRVGSERNSLRRVGSESRISGRRSP